MRAINTYWTFIILLLVSTNILAQKSATAVMNVSVSVISGVTLSEVSTVDINFDDNTISEGGFEITTPKSMDAQIVNQESVVITNEFGESITIGSDSSSTIDNDVRFVTLGADIGQPTANLRGTYHGTLTTTISYF
ncbi:MAG: hypothetical protein JJ966_04715 [Balneolaceae bacterium]|nr:hypothetical protein [Balneolaceae bacterium]